MKTQIIRRIVLAVIALLICYNNQGYNAQVTFHNSITINVIVKKITLDFKISVSTKNISNTTASITCHFCQDQNATPIIPEPNGDHEFHSFHIKDKHEKHAGFWKNVANKLLGAIFYVIVLITYMPFKH